jgi:hypothetical protein
MDGESQEQKTRNLKVVFALWLYGYEALPRARFVPFALLIDIPYAGYTQFTHRQYYSTITAW